MKFVRNARRTLQIVFAAAVIAATVPYAYLQMFSQFQIYDDEGHIMASVKTFLDGQALYDRTFSQYGPFYFLLSGLAYRVTGLAVGHDVTRIATIAMWIGAAALLALFVYAVTRSIALAVYAHLLAVLHCTGLIGEPGHPQGLLLVLVAALLLAAGAATAARVPILLGVVTGCIFMTKINLGVFAAGACVTALLSVSGGYRVWRTLINAAFSLLPFVLMRSALAGPTFVYAATAAAAIAACCIAAFRTPAAARTGLGPLLQFAAAFAATAVVVTIAIVILGTSIRGLIEGVMVAPLRLASVYGQQWALPAAAAWYGAAALVMALAFVLLPSETLRGRVAIPLKLAFAFWMLRVAMDGPVAKATIAPFVWVVMIPAGDEAGARPSLVRVLVALVAASQLLVAYPVAGNQQAWATLWLVAAALVGAADAAAALWPVRDTWIPRVADALLVAGAVYWFAPSYRTEDLAERYRVFVSLDLPHAQRIRLPRVQKRTYHAIVDAVRANCDTLVTMPGLDSFYFWTKMAPPTGFNVGTWMTLLDAPTQQTIVDAVAPHASACVIYHDGLMRGWVGGRDVEGAPLVKYIRTSFHTVRTFGEYEFMFRNGRQLPP